MNLQISKSPTGLDGVAAAETGKSDEIVEEIRKRGIGFPLTEGMRSLVATKSGSDALLRPNDWPAAPVKWTLIVSSGSPAAPCLLVTS